MRYEVLVAQYLGDARIWDTVEVSAKSHADAIRKAAKEFPEETQIAHFSIVREWKP